MYFDDFLNEAMDKQEWLKYIKTRPMVFHAVKIIRDIVKNGYKAYIVGGAVRDIILDTNPKDVDIATNMPIEKLDHMYKTYDIGKSKSFGIVAVNQGGFTYEIAQFRQDGKYTDGRRPDKVSITGRFKDDAQRRDFTINAMAIDHEGRIIDYFDGKKDMQNKILRTVGDPHERFGEDYLRMMRAARFSARLGFELDPQTKTAMKSHRQKIMGISPERIKDELVKMASQSGDKFANAILTLDSVGILEIILPEVTKLKEFKEMKDFHPEAYDGGEGTPFNHTIAALRKNKLADPLVNLSLLFHDVGKGTTYKWDNAKEKHTFHGHAEAAKDLIDTIAQRLKLSTKEKNAILFAAVNHMKMHKALDMKPSKIFKLVSDENWEVLKAVSYCDDACREQIFDPVRFQKIIDGMEAIKKKWGTKTVNKTVKVIDGKQVMKITGLPPGPQVGQIIQKVTGWIVDDGLKEPLDKLIAKAYKEILK